MLRHLAEGEICHFHIVYRICSVVNPCNEGWEQDKLSASVLVTFLGVDIKAGILHCYFTSGSDC